MAETSCGTALSALKAATAIGYCCEPTPVISTVICAGVVRLASAAARPSSRMSEQRDRRAQVFGIARGL